MVAKTIQQFNRTGSTQNRPHHDRPNCWKIMVATQNIDTLGPIWTFSLRVILTFVARGSDVNGCVLSYFEWTANVHCYTSCTLTALHCSKV